MVRRKDPERAGNGPIARRIGAVTATGVVIANMVGAGVFTTSGILAGRLPGSGWVLLAWVFGGLIALSGALAYAELATRMPEEGGEVVYLRRLFHPALGFLTGWTSLIAGFSVPVAASAIGAASYLSSGIGPMLGGAAPSDATIRGIALLLIALFTVLHSTGVRPGASVQNTLTAMKILLVLVLAGAGLVLAGGAGRGGEPIAFPREFPDGGNLAIGTAMMLVGFAYSGWNASAYIAGEVRRPRRTLPLSLVAGTCIVIVLYLLINLFVFRAVPFDELRGTITPVESAAARVFGPWMGRGLGTLVGFGLLSSLSAFLMIGPRVYFAMARAGLFFRFASRVHPRFGVPSRSVVLQGCLAAIMVMVGSFEQLLVYLGFALGVFPWLAVAGIFVARRRGIGEGTAVRTPGHPVTTLFYLTASLALLFAAWINRPVESTAAMISVAAGFPLYLLWRAARRRGENGRS
ncbi:MAG: amino acid permease [Candidatus Eisenbacteria bacterium]|nr:amino acid permease [Candidatus Eisenbacteria bacterium]